MISASRLEEKESEMRKEYNKLHDRYTETLRSHCDLMERVKILIGSDETLANNLGNALPFSSSFKFKRNELESSGEESNLKNDIPSPAIQSRQVWTAEADLSLEDASIIEDVEEIPRERDKDRDSDRDREPSSLTGK